MGLIKNVFMNTTRNVTPNNRIMLFNISLKNLENWRNTMIKILCTKKSHFSIGTVSKNMKAGVIK